MVVLAVARHEADVALADVSYIDGWLWRAHCMVCARGYGGCASTPRVGRALCNPVCMLAVCTLVCIQLNRPYVDSDNRGSLHTGHSMLFLPQGGVASVVESRSGTLGRESKPGVSAR